MNIADGIIQLFILVYQNVFLKLLPTNLPGISYSQFSTGIDSLHSFLAVPIYFINGFFPVDTLFSLIIAFITLNLILFVIRIGVAAFNAARGSGVRV